MKKLISMCALLLPTVAQAAVFTVVNMNNTGSGSFRQAILDANAAGGQDEIRFDIPGSGVHTILVSTQLPDVTGPTIIDGRTQPGFVGKPLIEIKDDAYLDDGIRISGGGSTLQGLVVSGFDRFGISLYAGGSNTLIGNYVGTDADGTTAVPNQTGGIIIENGSSDNIVGGSDPVTSEGGCSGDCNVISGNDQSGLAVSGPCSGNVIQNNFIGLGADGITALGNVVGLSFAPSLGDPVDNRVEGNVIAFNDAAGIQAYNGSERNQFPGNRIFSNGGLGIDLLPPAATTGVTANDAGDADAGANGLRNFPVLTSVISSDLPRVTGSLNATPGAAFTLEFFANDSCDASGHGEGKRPLGTAAVTTDGSGNADFTAALATAFEAGDAVTATATDADGNTSEFSACAMATAPGGFSFSADAVSVAEDAGSLVLTIQRSGGTQGAVSLKVVTGASSSGGTATEGSDYVGVSQTVAFADGDSSKTVAVEITDDANQEDDETFAATLSEPSGGAGIGTPSTVVITIADDETPPGDEGSDGGGCNLLR